MRNNHLNLYVLLFIIVVGVLILNGKEETKQYPSNQVENYMNRLQVSLIQFDHNLQLQQLIKTKQLTREQLLRTVNNIGQIFSSYVELKEIATTFHYFDVSNPIAEKILENLYTSFVHLHRENHKVIPLSDEQVRLYIKMDQFFKEMKKIDLLEMPLSELLVHIEEVSGKYKQLMEPLHVDPYETIK